MSRHMCKHGYDLNEQFCSECATPAELRERLNVMEARVYQRIRALEDDNARLKADNAKLEKLELAKELLTAPLVDSHESVKALLVEK